MRTFVPPMLGFLALLALAAPALAEEVVMRDGTVYEAEILAVEADGIRVTWHPPGGGVVTMNVAAVKLDPYFFYNLRDKAAGNDGKAHVDLALWALDQGLFNLAKAQVRKAAKVDPQLVKDFQEGKLPEIREGIARHVLESAQADMKTGRLEWAEEKLEALLGRMPDTEAGSEARDVMDALQALLAEKAAKDAEAERAKLDEQKRATVEAQAKLLEPAEKRLAKGKSLALEGLAEDSDTKALELLAQALRQGREALELLEKLAKEREQDAEFLQGIGRRTAWATEGMVKIHLHRSDLYLWRGSLKQARDEVEDARKLLPESASVVAAWQRILEAENDEDWNIHWQRARREGIGRFTGARGGGGGRRR